MSESNQHFAKYSHCKHGITKDGHTMFTADVIRDLNRKSYLESQLIEQSKLIDMLKDAANELCSMIDTENARLKSKILCTDLDEPSYYDHQTVFEAFKLISELEE